MSLASTERPAVRRIVVADDEPDIADLLRMELEFSGFDVQVAYNGEDARELVRSRAI